MFSCGKMPYPGVDAIDLPRFLDEGLRLDYPTNAANSSEMYVKAFNEGINSILTYISLQLKTCWQMRSIDLSIVSYSLF